MTTARTLAEAFSGHRFAEVYDHLAHDVRWALIGAPGLVGRDAVIQACERTSADLADTTTEFLRFVVAAGTDIVAVDAVGRYTDRDGAVSVVSSCDIYEFAQERITAITSYTVELDPGGLDDAFIARTDGT